MSRYHRGWMVAGFLTFALAGCAPYDHCTALYLGQAGVKHDFVRLPDVGIRGNAHMMMLEKNNQEIAGFIAGWAGKNIK